MLEFGLNRLDWDEKDIPRMKQAPEILDLPEGNL
jgi:hypothetical protein